MIIICYLKIKRFIDIVFSIVGLIILLPVFLIIAIVIIIDTGSPVIIKQKRFGIHKSYFNIVKFRTMRIDTPKDMPAHLFINSEQYITRTGKFLRKTGFDELPQIFNIIAGTMTIIGPRPVLWNEYDLIAERDKYGANDIVPGLTGWAQINGREKLSVNAKAKLDGQYVKLMSFKMDIMCFYKTIFTIFESYRVDEVRSAYKKRSCYYKDKVKLKK